MTQTLNKKSLIDQISSVLEDELATIRRSAEAAHEAATNDESKAEDQYDTRSLEASYLAGAQAKRAREIEKALNLLHTMETREFGPADSAALSALIELEEIGTGSRSRFLLIRQAAGIQVRIGGVSVQAITPESPMGEELLGRKQGETLEIELRGSTRRYRVISIS